MNQSTNLNNRLSENKFELKEDQFKRDDGFLKLIYDDKIIDDDLKNLVNAHKKHHELEGISVPNPPSIDNNSLLESTYNEFFEFYKIYRKDISNMVYYMLSSHKVVDFTLSSKNHRKHDNQSRGSKNHRKQASRSNKKSSTLF